MQMTKIHWVIIGGGLVVAVLIAFGLSHRAKAPVAETATSTPTTVATTTSLTTKQVASTTSVKSAAPQSGAAVTAFAINPADTVHGLVWNFKGAYAGNATLVAQADADIQHLTGLLGKGQYDDYDLYNGLANDYANLGDGAAAFKNYNRSIAVHPKKGLAYVNLAHLFDLLGAYHTAADAYAKAVAVEPGMLEYHLERLKFLTRQFPNDNARITAALADSAKSFGDTAPVLAIEAEWLTSVGRYADAIKAWQTAKMLSPGTDTSAIDSAIAALEAKK